jgi:hypothetical protein
MNIAKKFKHLQESALVQCCLSLELNPDHFKLVRVFVLICLGAGTGLCFLIFTSDGIIAGIER